MKKILHILKFSFVFLLLFNCFSAYAVLGDGAELSVDFNLIVGRYNTTTQVFTPLAIGETIAQNEIITVRVVPQSDFLVGSTSFVIMFDKVLYTVQGSNKPAFTVNSSNNYYAQACSGYSGTTNIPNSGWPTSFAAGERYDVYKAIKCIFMTDSNAPNGGWPELLPGTWLFQFSLKANQNITVGTNARIWMDTRWFRSSTNTNVAGYIAKCQAGNMSYSGSTVYPFRFDFTDSDIKLALSAPSPVTITFNSAGGSAVAPLTGNPGDPVVAPANPTKPGYTFAGWSPALPATFPASNLTVIAQWQTACVSPTIVSQSTSAQTKCLSGSFTAITVTATGDGLTYQWYKNTTAAASGGTSLGSANGAQTSSYTPQATIAGTLYYYCIVTGTCGTATSMVSGAHTTNQLTAITSQSTPAQTKCLNIAFNPITVTAAGANLNYQWYSNTTATNSGGASLGSANGAQTNSYTPQSTAAGTIYYYCVVTGSCGTVTSAVSGAYTTNQLTAITSQSTAAQTVCINGSFTPITVTATGPGLIYQWYKNSVASATGGTSLGTSNGANTNSYTPVANTAGTLYYYCVVTGTCGTETSAISGAFVVNPATIISNQSTAAQTKCLNAAFTAITVTATGAGTLSYQWYSNTTASVTGGASLGSANGAQTNSYTPQSTATGTLYYFCTVTGTCGTATSNISGAFQVNPATTISSQSTSAQTLCLNGSFTLITVTANGTGSLSYQWYKNTVATTTGGTSLGTGNGANSNSYTPQATVAGSLYYYCVVNGSCGSATSNVSGEFITRLSTAISSQSTPAQTKCLNGVFNPITVTAEGFNLSYQWYSNTSATNSGGISLGTGNGANTSSYTPQATATGTLYYYCVVTGDCGTATSAISGAHITNQLTAITSQSTASQTACINGSFNPITVTATGPGLTYQWYKNTVASASGGTSLGTGNGANTYSYTPRANTAGTLYYYCVVTGSCGTVTTDISGAFITNPVTAKTSQSTAAQTVCHNGSFSPITVTVTGANLTYQWYSNTTASNSGGLSLGPNHGATTYSYTPQSTATGTLYYYCVVTGSCGTVTSTASGAFLVNPTTAITSQSTAAQTQCVNGAYTPVTVTAIGPELIYQWYSNTSASASGGINLGDADGAQTSSYTPQATTAGTLYYYCVVSGTCGTATSTVSGAFVTTNGTEITSQSTDAQTRCINVAFNAINVNAAGPGLSFQWYSNGSPKNSGGTPLGEANGARTSSYTPQSTSAGTLYYYCIVTGTCGSATSAISGAFITHPATAITAQSTDAQRQCMSGSFNPITVTAQGSNLTYQWYSNTTSSNSGGTSLGSANGARSYSYTPQNNAAGTLYYYCTVSGGCVPANVTSAVSGEFVVVPAPTAPTSVTATPATICSGSTSNLTATSTGNNINWWSASSGGTYLGTTASGANFTTATISNTTTFYAESVSPPVSDGSNTYNYTGAQQSFTVPSGVTTITVDIRGASGFSAPGGRVQTTLNVTPGSMLYINVGGTGSSGSGAAGGWNGGGAAGTGSQGSNPPGSGGGASDIRVGGVALSNRVLIAGGGGGKGDWVGGAGGAGGSTTGANGMAGQGGGGGGGTPSSGGAGGTGYGGCSAGSAGASGIGGAGGSCSYSGGGGGGGYYGGGGGGGDNDSGGSDGGGGGGGSSYADPVVTSGTVHTQGYNSGNGQIIITWTGNNDGCTSGTRTPITVTVSQGPTGGTITGGTSPIIYGDPTGAMTLSGHTGTVQKWQSSPDGNTWTDITNTNTTYSATPTSAGTWQYRAVLNDGCSSSFSDPRTIVVSPKTLTIGGSFAAGNKPFDGNTTATITTNSLTLITKVGSDDVTLNAVAVFETSAAGNTRTVTVTGSSLTGAQASNYTLSLTGAPVTHADITPIPPTLGPFPAISKTYGDAPFVIVNPTSNSPGTFSYTSSNTTVATIAGNTVTILKAGTSTITAIQAASDPTVGYAATSTTALLTVEKADQVLSLTLPTSQPLSTFIGTSLPITASSSANLPVTVTLAPASTATATLSGTPGNYLLTNVSNAGLLIFDASQGGDENYHTASITQSFEVQKNNQTITFNGAFPLSYTYSPTLSIDLSAAASSSATLTVSYSLVSGPASLLGTTLTVTGAGVVVIKASQPGDGNTNPAPDVNQALTINKALPTLIFADINKTWLDAPFTLNATSDSPGAITYNSSNTGVVTTSMVSTVTTATLAGAGVATLTATQAASDNYTATTTSATLTVAKANQTITFNPLADKIEGDPAFNLAASSTSSLTVSYNSSNTSVASIGGNTVTVGSAGTTTITASQNGNDNFNAAPSVDQLLTVHACLNPTNGGTIAESQSYCSSFKPAKITSTSAPSGHTSSTILEYKWQQSTTSSSAGFTDIPGATASTYDPATVTVTTWFKRLARVTCHDWTGAAESNVLEMAILSLPVGGTVSGTSSLTYGSSTGTMTLSGETGSVLKWQQMEGSGSWTDIANTTTACTATPTSVTTWKYRAVVTNGCVEAYSSALTITVSPKPLTITGITAVNKPYDGNRDATLAGTAVLDGVISPDVVNLAGTPEPLFASPNVATGVAVTVTGYTLSGANAGNYTLSQPTGLTANITPVQLTPHITAYDKHYDGNTEASLSARWVTGMVNGETGVTLLVGAKSFDVPNTGTRTVTAGTLTLGGSRAVNYTLASGATATATASITAIELTPQITANDKPYDGNTTATLSSQTVTGMVNGETQVFLGVTAANFDTKNIGTDITVTATGLSLSGAQSGNYTLVTGATAIGTASITAVQLTPHITANDKQYDGNTAASLSGQSVTGMVPGETAVNLEFGEANFDTKNIGTNKTVTATNLSLSGADAGNYELAAGATATDLADITAITLTPHIIANNKPYDGNTTATLSSQTLTGIIPGETVTLGVGAANFSTSETGNNILVTATTLSLGGADAGNYLLGAGATATSTANITALQLTPHITANDKSYNGNTTATLSAQWVTGMVNGETDVTLTVTASNFDTKDIGTGKTVTATGLSLGGTMAGNYVLEAGATAAGTASITAIQLTPHITANNKPYDGLTTATLSAQWVSGMVNGETAVTLEVGDANFDTKNIGTNKTVTAGTLTLGGADAGNYVVASGATATSMANITAIQLTPQITANDKPYDGTTSATLGEQLVTGFVSGETVTLLVGSSDFDTKNVGFNKTVTAINLALGGADAGNYVLASGATATSTASITDLQVIPHITSNDKPYDGNTTATLSAKWVSGIVNNETVNLEVGSADFDNKNTGTNKTVTAITLMLSGADAGNYYLATGATATDLADITPVQLTPHITASSKTYDGATTATLLSQTVTGTITGEVVNLIVGAANFDNKNIGTGKTVTASDLSLSGQDAGNYVLEPGATATSLANIYSAELTVTGAVALNKIYDRTNTAIIDGATLHGVISPDEVNLENYTTGTFAQTVIGTDIPVATLPMTITGAGIGNYTLTQPIGLEADILPKTLDPIIIAENKCYDGTTIVNISSQSLDGVVDPDVVSLHIDSAKFEDPNVGTDKVVFIYGLALEGADASNYSLLETTIAISANIYLIPPVDPIPDQRVCNGGESAQVNFTGSAPEASYYWVSSNPSIGTWPEDIGSYMPSFTMINTGTGVVSSTITVTPFVTGEGITCWGTPTTFDIAVTPTPTVEAVDNQTVCHNGLTSLVQFTGAVPGTLFNWTNDNTSIGLAANGTGDITSFNAVNTGTAPVVANIVVTPVFADGGIDCPGQTRTFTITVNPSGQVDQPANQVVCNGAQTTVVNFTTTNTGGTTTYAWTNDTPSIGLAASGSGNIAEFTAVNTGTSPMLATIIVTPTFTNGGVSCSGPVKTFTITVNPTGQVNQPASQVLCNSATTIAVNFTTTNTGGTTTYAWTNDTPSIGLAASGSGDIAAFTATNTGTSPVVATIVVTPTFTDGGDNPLYPGVSCQGPPETFYITVNPIPGVEPVPNQSYCNGVNTPEVIINGPVAATVYHWINSNPAIGLPANGSGNIPSFTAINPGTSTVTAVITVTPVFSNQGVACFGIPVSFSITVYPSPQLTPVVSQVLCHNQPTLPVNFISTLPGTEFFWDNSDPSIGLPGSGTGIIPSFTALNNGIIPANATITVVPSKTMNGMTCQGPPEAFAIIVNPIPAIDPVESMVVCAGQMVQPVIFSGPVPGTRFIWSNNNPLIGLPPAGTGNLPVFLAMNHSSVPISAEVYVVPVFENGGTLCEGIPILFTITVNPTPDIIVVPSQTVCNGSQTSPILFTGSVPGTIFSWTNSNPSIGLPSSGIGSIAPFTAINNAAYPVTATITVTTSFTNAGVACTGASTVFLIVVNPVPGMNPVSGQVLMNGSSTSPVTFSGGFSGTIYEWVNDHPSIGIPASGTGDIPAFIATNNGAAVVTATITVYPVYYNAGTGCTGEPQSFEIVVNPIPTVNPQPDLRFCHATISNYINFTSPVQGTIFYWTNSDWTIGLPSSGTGDIAPFMGINTNGTAPKTATITVTPWFSNAGASAFGPPVTFNIIVNPLPLVDPVMDQVLCNGQTTVPIVFTGYDPTSTYFWSNTNPSIGIAPYGYGNIPAFITVNNTAAPQIADFGVAPTAVIGGVACTGNSKFFTIRVNPATSVNQIDNQQVCHNAITNLIEFTGGVPGTIYQWTNNEPAIGLPASGSGSIAPFVALNPANQPIAATITVNPVYASGGVACQGSAMTFTITVNPLPPTPHLSGPTLVHASTGPHLYTSDPLMSGYTWSLSPGGTIVAGGSTTDHSASVVWSATGQQWIAVNYANPSTGCTGASPGHLLVTVQPAPFITILSPNGGENWQTGSTHNITWNSNISGNVSIELLENGALNRIIAAGVPSAGVFPWLIPADVTIGSNYRVKIISDADPTLFDISNADFTISGQVPVNLELTGISVADTRCFNALQTITVAGGGTLFNIEPTGSVTMIAGQNILYLPGTTVQPGGYLHGYIAPNGPWCGTQSPSIPNNTVAGSGDAQSVPVENWFRVFPNPTTGKFTLELSGETGRLPVTCRIYNLLGEIISETNFNESNKHIFDIEGRQPGIYLIKVTSGKRIGSSKVILKR